jgi:hypothetical protein
MNTLQILGRHSLNSLDEEMGKIPWQETQAGMQLSSLQFFGLGLDNSKQILI